MREKFGEQSPIAFSPDANNSSSFAGLVGAALLAREKVLGERNAQGALGEHTINAYKAA